jgi:hypothetical protein
MTLHDIAIVTIQLLPHEREYPCTERPGRRGYVIRRTSFVATVNGEPVELGASAYYEQVACVRAWPRRRNGKQCLSTRADGKSGRPLYVRIPEWNRNACKSKPLAYSDWGEMYYEVSVDCWNGVDDADPDLFDLMSERCDFATWRGCVDP